MRYAINNLSLTTGRARVRPTRCIAAAALTAALLLQTYVAAFAETKRLDCNLTRLQTKTGENLDVTSEDRSLKVIFDEEAKTLAVDSAGRTLALDHVTMTPITMTGYAGDISLGIDRSNWSIVLQTYKLNSVSSEFGTCSQTDK